jgi:hypothetical protein
MKAENTAAKIMAAFDAEQAEVAQKLRDGVAFDDLSRGEQAHARLINKKRQRLGLEEL